MKTIRAVINNCAMQKKLRLNDDCTWNIKHLKGYQKLFKTFIILQSTYANKMINSNLFFSFGL